MFYKLVKGLDLAIEKIVSVALVTVVITLLIFSVLAIFFRWFNTPIVWSEPFIRHLVFLIAFLGGVIATGRRAHISIDILSRYFVTKDNKKYILRFSRFIFFISTIVVSWLSYSSLKLAQVEFLYGKVSFLGIHSGFLVSIIPTGLALIAYRFFFLFVDSFSMYNEEFNK